MGIPWQPLFWQIILYKFIINLKNRKKSLNLWMSFDILSKVIKFKPLKLTIILIILNEISNDTHTTPKDPFCSAPFIAIFQLKKSL
jgi:hypothetical protein